MSNCPFPFILKRYLEIEGPAKIKSIGNSVFDHKLVP